MEYFRTFGTVYLCYPHVGNNDYGKFYAGNCEIGS